MKFGCHLKELRKNKNLSQESLAEKVGVSRQSVSKWECGEAYPTMDNILTLCEVFNCKINDIVHSELTDINLLDEEIKMSKVKFEKKKQNEVKTLSKIIYVLSRILKIITLIGIISVVLTMITIPIVTSNIKVTSLGHIEIFNENFDYKRDENKITITYNEKEVEITKFEETYALNKILDKLENSNIRRDTIITEIILVFLIISLILLYKTFTHLENLFINIHKGETPFTKENITHIKKMAYLMILTIIIPNISGLLTEFIIDEDLGIGFEAVDFIYILFLYSMSYIFEYGYELQLDTKAKMYGDYSE